MEEEKRVVNWNSVFEIRICVQLNRQCVWESGWPITVCNSHAVELPNQYKLIIPNVSITGLRIYATKTYKISNQFKLKSDHCALRVRWHRCRYCVRCRYWCWAGAGAGAGTEVGVVVFCCFCSIIIPCCWSSYNESTIRIMATTTRLRHTHCILFRHWITQCINNSVTTTKIIDFQWKYWRQRWQNTKSFSHNLRLSVQKFIRVYTL